MGVADGQAVNASVSNAAWLDATADDTATGKLTLSNVEAVSGSSVTNIQTEHNSIASFAGKALNSVKDDVPTYANDEGFTANNSLFDRLDEASGKFKVAGGHTHSGAAGDGGAIGFLSLSNTQLIGYGLAGTDLTGVTGGSHDVSTELSGKSDSSGSTVKGVVVLNPYNYVHIFDDNSDSYLDGTGNKVYGRLTYSNPVWTLTFYSNIAGVETAYSFAGSNDVKWYYQELFDETDRPVYSDVFVVQSDQIAGEIPTATTSLKGKVDLSSTAAQSVGSSNAAGTANANVANADHAHQGVHGVYADGANIYGDVQIVGSGAASATQSGQIVTVGVTAISNANLADMATQTFKGRTTAGTGAPEDLTATQATAMLNTFTDTLKGLVPLSGGGTTNFLRADGSFAAPPAGLASPLTTKGDIWAYDTGNNRLPVGTNEQVLTADSTVALGVKWATPVSATPTIFGTRGTPRDVAVTGITSAASHMSTTAARQKLYVQGNGGAIDITANPQIDAGTIDGQEMVIVGRSDTNTLLLEDGNGLSLNGACLLGANVTITLSWDNSVWVEVSRSL